MTGISSRKMKANTDMFASSFLFEISWEVCNQIGGIYRVINSKLHLVKKRWNNNYCLLGPYFHGKALSEFESTESDTDFLSRTASSLKEEGYGVYDGNWLVTGKPRVILFDPETSITRLGDIKYELWEKHNIPVNKYDDLLDRVLAFGFLIKLFFQRLCENSVLEEKK